MSKRRAYRPHRVFAAGVLICSALVAASAARSSHTALAPDRRLVPGASRQDDKELARIGERATAVACDTACHALEFLDKRRTIREWDDVMVDMIGRGTTLTADEDALIRRYLRRYYGVVDVNAASAEDLSAVLGLSAKDARAVIDYRTGHGRFVDAAALTSVPDIDKSKIGAQPKALRFDSPRGRQ